MIRIGILLWTAHVLLAQDVTDVRLCDLVKDPSSFHGKMVRITGEILRGNMENGPALIDRACADSIKIGDRSFGNVVILTSSWASDGDLKVPFQWDSSEARLFEIGERIDPRRERIVGTVIGVFETRTPLTLLLTRGGFGHLSGSSGQILVRTVTDVRVEPAGP